MYRHCHSRFSLPLDRCRLLALTVVVGALSVVPSNVVLGGEPLELQRKTGDPVPGLTAAELDRFFKGEDAFSRTLSTSEGLGPVFNDHSCISCHNAGGTGGAGTLRIVRFGFWDPDSGEFDPLEELGGTLIQDNVADGLDPVLCSDWNPANLPNEDNPANHTANRITNATFGAGLVEAIPDADILANEGVHGGVVHMVPVLEDPDSPLRVGRMGWKAQLATVKSFTVDAALNEMGITSVHLPNPVPPRGDASLLEFCDTLGPPHPQDPDHEGQPFTDRVTDFQRFLAAPPQTPKSGMTGEDLFIDIGCAQCHVPSFTTSDSTELEEALRDREIRPYSDFLLHNMGLAADFIPQGEAGETFIRTPSLWGLRHRNALMHNGDVEGGSLADRILGTGSIETGVIDLHRFPLASQTAIDSADAFFELTEEEQMLIVDFLDSLGRPEFDYIGDNAVGNSDFTIFVECYSGSSESYALPGENPMDDFCAIGDINQNGFIDETDFEMFLLAYEGNQEPCDLWLQLADGVSPGVDVNVPGECVCPGDLDGSGVVDAEDLFILLGSWGSCADPDDCPADLNGDHVVDSKDLFVLLGDWGVCKTGSNARGRFQLEPNGRTEPK